MKNKSICPRFQSYNCSYFLFLDIAFKDELINVFSTSVFPAKLKTLCNKMLQEIDFLDNDIKKASEIFSALGHPIRLKIAYFSRREITASAR